MPNLPDKQLSGAGIPSKLMCDRSNPGQESGQREQGLEAMPDPGAYPLSLPTLLTSLELGAYPSNGSRIHVPQDDRGCDNYSVCYAGGK